MNAASFDEALDKILLKDPRYHREAYVFVREALDYTTQKVGGKSSKSEARQAGSEGRPEHIRHVTGQELLSGIRSFALEQFGPMAFTVLQEWGVSRCEDFGEIVFNMVDNNLLNKTKEDSRDDFKSGYSFEEAFRKPFLPATPAATPGTVPKPSEA